MYVYENRRCIRSSSERSTLVAELNNLSSKFLQSTAPEVQTTLRNDPFAFFNVLQATCCRTIADDNNCYCTNTSNKPHRRGNRATCGEWKLPGPYMWVGSEGNEKKSYRFLTLDSHTAINKSHHGNTPPCRVCWLQYRGMQEALASPDMLRPGEGP